MPPIDPTSASPSSLPGEHPPPPPPPEPHHPDPQHPEPEHPQPDPCVRLRDQPPLAIIELDAPHRRNALDMAMLAEIERILDGLEHRRDIRVLLIRGLGPAFCAGFDLTRVVDDPPLMVGLIGGLARILRRLRQRDQATIAAVHGAALAGGCAIVGACDLSIVAPDASLGYPVHRIGVSPAVSSPTTAAATGGAVRPILLGGEIVDGATAVRLGLATHLARSAETVVEEAMRLADGLMAKGPDALRATKAWLNEIDGTANAALFDEAAAASAGVATSDEAMRLLESFWARRASR